MDGICVCALPSLYPYCPRGGFYPLCLNQQELFVVAWETFASLIFHSIKMSHLAQGEELIRFE